MTIPTGPAPGTANASDPDPLAPVEPTPTTPPLANLNGWRRTVRTVLQTLVALAVAAPFVYEAITHQSAAAATGAGATVLAVAGTIARVMSLPQVEDTLQRIAPWLSAHAPVHDWADDQLDELANTEPVPPLPDNNDPGLPNPAPGPSADPTQPPGVNPGPDLPSGD